MDTETLQTILSSGLLFLSNIVSVIVTYLVAKRKNKVKIEDIYSQRVIELLNEYKDEAKSLRETLNEVNKKNDELHDLVLKLKDENHDLKGKLDEVINENKDLKLELNNLKVQNEAILEQNRTLILKSSNNN